MEPDVPHEERRESDLVLPEGLEAGVLGGLAVVAVYCIPDWLAGDFLRTPAQLGALLLDLVGVDARSYPAGSLAIIYTGVHFVGWVLAGFAGSALMRAAERNPELRRLPLVLFALWLVAALAIDLWLVGRGFPMTPLWAGSLIAGCLFGAYLLWRHPEALRTG